MSTSTEKAFNEHPEQQTLCAEFFGAGFFFCLLTLEKALSKHDAFEWKSFFSVRKEIFFSIFYRALHIQQPWVLPQSHHCADSFRTM